ncbi:lysoplasmalogenase-like protein TMEM86A [Mercenaria mercenaria]|uniref:lysoplasmalogenase-like protein TMEM86A n=1 Tax=Mercenaria mercenaria TaxID=6596 RepID=UPI001E1DDCCC|nr:lysoplasmalogenase-like protein TMEM86A [Mercenaria mercenaria]
MEIPEQFSINLSREQKMHLVPFFATWLIYFVLYMPFWGYPPETLGSVFFKVLPIISLCYYVISTSNGFKGFPKKDELIPDDDRARHFLFALLFSAVGDACLVWRELLFVPGLLSFAIAQTLYCKGLNGASEKSRTKDLFFLLGLDIFLIIQSGISSYVLSALVGMYIALIFAVAWRATARYELEGSKAAFAGCAGALIFIFSDFIIAVDKWCFHVPFAPSMIMSSYYIAQLFLSLSTSKDLH